MLACQADEGDEMRRVLLTLLEQGIVEERPPADEVFSPEGSYVP
jgi:hypothetical protein